MGKSIAEIHEEVLNHNARWEDFPVGTHVKIVCLCEDFYFFYGETGIVTENTGKYLGLRVKFDEPRHFEGGYIQYDFNFEPHDLVVIDPVKKPLHEQLLDKLYKYVGD